MLIVNGKGEMKIGTLPNARMGPFGIVMNPPSLDRDLRFF